MKLPTVWELQTMPEDSKELKEIIIISFLI
jgi:hypothetical protein